ncbi:dienelactone hydrolase family protein [uncultured Meiothermus sp.]|jgi:carboxymethylenebutenolidase|uniref:dienelactone hydrolase family protein n=1 Tax=uncultured Meiothermus sp. TaxID=157471 RepID=UPI00260C9F4F|nr:dienelactone hydrolase family protein [uncultured Meiothermus sp.]
MFRQDLFRYVAEEFAEDYREGELERREFLRRSVLLGGGVPGARALLASLGITGVSVSELAQAQQAPAQTQQAQAQPLVSPTDPAIQIRELSYKARDIDQIAYLARPAGGGSHPGVIVIHENRGLQPHIQDVARRLAKAGYIALAPDLVSKIGGTAKIADTAQISAYLAQAGGDEHMANLQEALKVLKATQGVQADKLGVTGFCFGGGLTWRMATEVAELKAAVPFYGPAPDLARVPNIKAALLGIYGGHDTRINAGIPALETALKAANIRYQIKIYEGANHAFHNDTGANYKKDAAEDAWNLTLNWFKTYLI